MNENTCKQINGRINEQIIPKRREKQPKHESKEERKEKMVVQINEQMNSRRNIGTTNASKGKKSNINEALNKQTRNILVQTSKKRTKSYLL